MGKADDSFPREMAAALNLPEEPKESAATFHTCDTTTEFTAAHDTTFNSDNGYLEQHGVTSSCDNNIQNKFTLVSSTPTPSANLKSFKVEYEMEKPKDYDSQVSYSIL